MIRGEGREERGERNALPLEPSSDEGLSAEGWYKKGNALRKQSKWGEAISCYMEAIAIDPQSPAVEAKEMLEEILNFYNKDAYNP